MVAKGGRVKIFINSNLIKLCSNAKLIQNIKAEEAKRNGKKKNTSTNIPKSADNTPANIKKSLVLRVISFTIIALKIIKNIIVKNNIPPTKPPSTKFSIKSLWHSLGCGVW